MRAAALLLALAAPAGATKLFPACQMDTAAWKLMDYDNSGGSHIAPVYPMREAPGFVHVNWFGPEAGWRTDVLIHCESGQHLVILHEEPYDGPQVVYDRYRELIDSAESYSFRQIGEELAALGAQVRISNDDLGRCACDVFGF